MYHINKYYQRKRNACSSWENDVEDRYVKSRLPEGSQERHEQNKETFFPAMKHMAEIILKSKLCCGGSKISNFYQFVSKMNKVGLKGRCAFLAPLKATADTDG